MSNGSPLSILCISIIDTVKMKFGSYINKVNEVSILAVHKLGKALGARVSDLASAVGYEYGLIVVVEEDLASGGACEY